jgi:hypothetical protein
MKAIKLPYLLFTAIILLSTSCSSDSDNDNVTPNDDISLENTLWNYSNNYQHEENSILSNEDKFYPAVLERMALLHDLNYTDGIETKKTPIDCDICYLSKHECDSTINASFTLDKCVFNIEITKKHIKAERTKLEKYYKFKEGEYIICTGTAYEGITVYNYGIYRASGALYLPLDGKGRVVYEKVEYFENKEKYTELIKKCTLVTHYKITGDEIIFSYNEDGQNKSFKGRITNNGATIYFKSGTIVNKPSVFRRQ